MIYTDEQQELIRQAVNWYRNSSRQVFAFSGPAGTGKSVMLHAIIQAIGLSYDEVLPMAYCGAAAVVMRLKGFKNAKTIHSSILTRGISMDYSDTSLRDKKTGKVIPGIKTEWIRKPIDKNIKLIVIDEAGQVPKYLTKFIEEDKNIKVLVAGDLDQLPPVKDQPGYLYGDPNVFVLTKVMRQNKGSSIVYLSQRIKQGLPIHLGYYGDTVVLYDDELTDEHILKSDAIICGRNDTRESLTNYIRSNLFGYDPNELPKFGERLICRSNKWNETIDDISLANGVCGNVTSYPTLSDISNDKKTFKIDFQPLMISKSFKNVEVNKDYFFADANGRKTFDRFKMEGLRFEYGYVLTTHISQGSQYHGGIYVEEELYRNSNINKNLWYTGITRFSNLCFYIKHRRRYYNMGGY